MSKSFMGERVKERVISLGTGGEITRDEEEFPTPPKRSLVTFQATAKFETVKHKFLDKGGVKESVILTIVTDSFEVLSIEEAPEQAELPEIGEGAVEGEVASA